ncbi:hypothetical protein F4809DRAFT_447643 [Biscogniauxia mediterranea]|nr:hypothetical protein F4809DRAFT_447643 [Biscogniauxia mediterranea]
MYDTYAGVLGDTFHSSLMISPFLRPSSFLPLLVFFFLLLFSSDNTTITYPIATNPPKAHQRLDTDIDQGAHEGLFHGRIAFGTRYKPVVLTSGHSDRGRINPLSASPELVRSRQTQSICITRNRHCSVAHPRRSYDPSSAMTGDQSQLLHSKDYSFYPAAAALTLDPVVLYRRLTD